MNYGLKLPECFFMFKICAGSVEINTEQKLQVRENSSLFKTDSLCLTKLEFVLLSVFNKTNVL